MGLAVNGAAGRPGLSPLARRAYRLARGYVLACGLLLILATLASQAVMPDLYYDAGTVPSWPERAAGAGAALAYALLLLLPYRWSGRGWLYRARLAVLLLFSAALVAIAGSMLLTFADGGRDWRMVPVAVAAFVLAVLAPGTLFARVRWVGVAVGPRKRL